METDHGQKTRIASWKITSHMVGIRKDSQTWCYGEEEEVTIDTGSEGHEGQQSSNSLFELKMSIFHASAFLDLLKNLPSRVQTWDW